MAIKPKGAVMQVELMKKEGQYTDKDGVAKKTMSFYLQCGDTVVPVEPVYYNKKDKHGAEVRDYGYSNRKSVLSAFASTLPEKKA